MIRKGATMGTTDTELALREMMRESQTLRKAGQYRKAISILHEVLQMPVNDETRMFAAARIVSINLENISEGKEDTEDDLLPNAPEYIDIHANLTTAICYYDKVGEEVQAAFRQSYPVDVWRRILRSMDEGKPLSEVADQVLPGSPQTTEANIKSNMQKRRLKFSLWGAAIGRILGAMVGAFVVGLLLGAAIGFLIIHSQWITYQNSLASGQEGS
jgi:hypothetical protein